MKPDCAREAELDEEVGVRVGLGAVRQQVRRVQQVVELRAAHRAGRRAHEVLEHPLERRARHAPESRRVRVPTRRETLS